MGKNLIRTPLMAVLYASVLYFSAALLPFSEAYRQAAAEFVMPAAGYLFMVVVGLWVSAALAILYANARKGGARLAAGAFVSLFGIQWITPMLPAVLSGAPGGVMTVSDLLYTWVAGAAASLALVILAALLFQVLPTSHPAKPGTPQKPQDKYKIKPLGLVLKLVMLTVVYCVLYFFLWYFFVWRVQDARLYYGGAEELTPWMNVLIEKLLTDGTFFLMALLRGLLYALLLLLPMMELKAKRGAFVAVSIALFLSPGLLLLIPNAFVPDAVRFADFLNSCVGMAVYGMLSAFLLHTSVLKEKPQEPRKSTASARPAAGAKPAISNPAGTANTAVAKKQG